jgi:hypothetical protein
VTLNTGIFGRQRAIADTYELKLEVGLNNVLTRYMFVAFVCGDASPGSRERPRMRYESFHRFGGYQRTALVTPYPRSNAFSVDQIRPIWSTEDAGVQEKTRRELLPYGCAPVFALNRACVSQRVTEVASNGVMRPALRSERLNNYARRYKPIHIQSEALPRCYASSSATTPKGLH